MLQAVVYSISTSLQSYRCVIVITNQLMRNIINKQLIWITIVFSISCFISLLIWCLVLLSFDILQGSFRLYNWLSLRRLVSWINHLPHACWSTFCKSTFKQQLNNRLDNISSFFCILTYAILYVLMHHIIFRLYLYSLNNVLYFFKYSCNNISIDVVFILSMWINVI